MSGTAKLSPLDNMSPNKYLFLHDLDLTNDNNLKLYGNDGI